MELWRWGGNLLLAVTARGSHPGAGPGAAGGNLPFLRDGNSSLPLSLEGQRSLAH